MDHFRHLRRLDKLSSGTGLRLISGVATSSKQNVYIYISTLKLVLYRFRSTARRVEKKYNKNGLKTRRNNREDIRVFPNVQ